MSTLSAARRSSGPPTAAAPEAPDSAVVDVEVIAASAPDALGAEQVRRLCAATLAAAGITDGHVAVEFVDAQRIAELNRKHRGRGAPTDVLSFPLDGAEPASGPRELGDVVICPAHTSDLAEAVVHGVLHLAGMDHETDGGEMVALQEKVMRARSEANGDTRAGFVAVAGRPNVGKSTLVNALVGRKVVIVSDRPQTTRRAIRGVASGPDWQLVLVDLPGVQRPRDALTERMQNRVESELADADLALLVLNAEQGVGPGDRFLARALHTARLAVVIAVNKVDRADRARTVSVLAQAAELRPEAEVFPVSARTGKGVAALREYLASQLPAGPFFFSSADCSDQTSEQLVGELVREQVLRRTFQEIPHAVEVVIEEIESRRPGHHRVRALVWVEAESQKGIVIGAGGSLIKAIGTAARREIERELGGHVHLDLSVRVRRRWRADEGLLDRLGID